MIRYTHSARPKAVNLRNAERNEGIFAVDWTLLMVVLKDEMTRVARNAVLDHWPLVADLIR